MNIKLKNIYFDQDTGFRKLKNLNLDIGNKLTLIAGHNGLGKSTILALIANASAQEKYKTILNKKFQAEFSEIFHIDYNKDYEIYEAQNQATPYAILCYQIQKDTPNLLLKKCQIIASQKVLSKEKLKFFHQAVDNEKLTPKQLSELQEEQKKSPNATFYYRPRVIPRTHNGSNTPFDKMQVLTSKDAKELLNIGDSAKVLLPTIYIGMSRMSPTGEFDSFDITSDEQTKISPSALEFYNYCYTSIFPPAQINLQPNNCTNISAYEMKFKGSRKNNIVSDIENTILNISLGQDSISTIITALVSFYNLQESHSAEYNGGILVIDEIEAGLHPRAQEKLIYLLYEQAKKLDLQIIFTTHSLTVIQSVFYLDRDNDAMYKQNAINYLQDTQFPKLLSNPTYLQIKNDMLLSLDSYQNEKNSTNEEKAYTPKLNVYFEDMEAKDFFEALLSFHNITDTLSNLGATLTLIPAKLGCSNLLALIKADTYFQNALIILDDDVALEQESPSTSFSAKYNLLPYKNIVKLPGTVYLSKQKKENMPPDQLLFYYLLDALNHGDRSFWDDQSHSLTTNLVRDRILNYPDLIEIAQGLSKEDRTSKETPRKLFKRWYNEHRECLIQNKLFEKWATKNPDIANTFLQNLKAKIELLVTMQSNKT